MTLEGTGAGSGSGGRLGRAVAWLLCFAVLSAGVAAAQEPQPPRAPPFPIRPTLAAVRVTPSEAPVIDGDVSDPVWQRAEVVREFWQAQPNPGDAATERTEVRVLYDENNLYLAIYAYDSRPELMAIRAMSRDGQIGTGETVRIVFDPGMTRRNGYTFQVAPSGGRIDALLQNNSQNIQQWDTIWAARSRIVSDGWTVEIAIPFRSLGYDGNRTD